MTAPRFTLDGGAELEAELALLCAELADCVRQSIAADDLVAGLLIGGYGRGEGGVLVDAAGRERPHNNLDLLVVVADAAAARIPALRAGLDARVQALARARGVGLDAGVIPERVLRRGAHLVMWYDLRHGHRTLCGDAAFAPGLTRHVVERIDPADVRDLLVNRATLLVINDLLLSQRSDDPEVRRTVVRHAAKAAIGVGDALLFAAGHYHWSYAERLTRMRALAAEAADAGTAPGSPLSSCLAAFAPHYLAALSFRFRPDYAARLADDLPAMATRLRAACEPVHRVVEAQRLGLAALAWDGYAAAAERAACWSRPADLRALLRRGRDVLRRPSLSGQGLGWRALSARGRLALLLPGVLYGDPALRGRAVSAFALPAQASDTDLRCAFLRAWGRDGDPNLVNLLRRHGVDL